MSNPTTREKVAGELTAKLVDLLKQATTERSHYYVASVVRECIAYLAVVEADARERERKAFVAGSNWGTREAKVGWSRIEAEVEATRRYLA
jgi:hypothetical protein